MNSSARKSFGKRRLPFTVSTAAEEREFAKDIRKHHIKAAENPENKSTGPDTTNLRADHKPHKILFDKDDLKSGSSSSSEYSRDQSSASSSTQRLPYKCCSTDRYFVDLVYKRPTRLCEVQSHSHEEDSGSHSDSASESKSDSPSTSYAFISTIGGSEKSGRSVKTSKRINGSTRVLRSATRGQTTHFNKKKKKCHLCRERMEDFKLTRCANYSTCHGAFCTPCLEKHFKSKLKKEKVKKMGDGWVCFLCRGMCQCHRCQDDLKGDLIAILSGKGIENAETKKNAKEITRSNSTASPEGELKEDSSKIEEKKQNSLSDKRHFEGGSCSGAQFAELRYPVFHPCIYQDSQLYYQPSYLQQIEVPGEVPTFRPQPQH